MTILCIQTRGLSSDSNSASRRAFKTASRKRHRCWVPATKSPPPPPPRVIEARNGSRFGMGWENALLAGAARVSVVKMQPYETLVAGADYDRLDAVWRACGRARRDRARGVPRTFTDPPAWADDTGRRGSRPRTSGSLCRPARPAKLARWHARSSACARKSMTRQPRFKRKPRSASVSSTRPLTLSSSPTLRQVRSGKPKLNGDIGLQSRRNERPQRRRINPSRRPRTDARGDAPGPPRPPHAQLRERDTCTRTATRSLFWSGVWLEPERRYFFIGRDMTESKAAQQALLESEQMGRGIAEGLSSALYRYCRAVTLGRKDAPLPAGQRLEFEALRKDGQKIKVEVP